VTQADNGSANEPLVGRRTLLTASAGVAGVVVLAGCGNAASSGTAGSGTGAGNGAGSGGGNSSTPTPDGLAAVSSIPVGGAVSATSGGAAIVIARPTTRKVVAFSAVCTHMGCTVVPQGDTYVCPCHGSTYDAATGAVISGPAPAPLAAFPVKVVQGEVVANT
jgi:cytochrome b6-f complex iron-sulfur subunit